MLSEGELVVQLDPLDDDEAEEEVEDCDEDEGDRKEYFRRSW